MPAGAAIDQALHLSERYQTVAEANRRLYAEPGLAEDYSRTTLTSPQERRLLLNDLKRALSVLGEWPHPIRALDCCGGAGAAALMLQELGCRTHLVDISPQMIECYASACRARGWPVSTHCSEIAEFFARGAETFDLMVFSSALHHLEDPLLVLELARRRLAPGGVIVTIFDPLRMPRWKNRVLEPARILDRILLEPALAMTRTIPVLKRILQRGDRQKQANAALELNTDNVGYLAEFHGDTGFNDRAFAADIQHKTGLRILHHEQYIAYGGPILSFARWLLQTPTSFKLLLQNPPASSP